MAKIFLSYSRKDSAIARRLIDAFKEMGHDPWVDWEDIPPAVGWLEQIFRGIEGSDTFFFLVSPDSAASEVCGVEVSKAQENNKRIIPIVVRDVNTREVKVHPTIGELNWIKLREGDSFEEALALIKIAIELDIDWVEEHSRLQLRALEWHRANEASLLLRGNDLRKSRAAILKHESSNPRPTEIQRTYIDRSDRDEWRRFILWTMTTIAVILLTGLTWYALVQRNEARINEQRAREQETLAKQNEAIANENRIAAELNEAEAGRQAAAARAAQITAEAQRSAAKAQIYQSRTGELYTSTLLAIDSWQGEPSDEAEEILRRNISLLPLPIAKFGHTGRINSLELSPDGAMILTASADRSACVLKSDDGIKVFCASSPEAVNDAVYSPDGSLIVTGDESGLVQFLSAQDGSVQFEINYRVPIRNLDIRPDGRLLAISKADGIINIFDLRQRKESFFLQTTGTVYQSGFSPNGRYFASGSTLGVVTIWNLDTGQIFSKSRHRGEVLSLAFSPKSEYLITGGKDGYSVFTYTSTGESPFRNPHEDWVDDIAFSRDGSWYVTVSHDNKIRVWETLSNNERLRMAQDSFVEAVVVSGDGQWIATTGSDQTVRVWSASTGAELFQIPLKSGGTALAFSLDGKLLITGDSGGSLQIWDISNTPIPEKSYLFNGLVGDLQFDTTGEVLAASDETRIWRLNPNDASSPTTSLQGNPYLDLRSIVKELEFGADSKYLAVSTTADQVFIDVLGPQLTSKALATTGVVEAIAFSSGQEQFITASANGLVQAWNYIGGSSSDPIPLFDDITIKSLAAHGSVVAIGSSEKVTLIDLTSGRENEQLESPGDNLLLAFSADGSMLASASSSGKIHLWRNVNGDYALSHTLLKPGAASIALNTTGDFLVVGTTTSAVLIDTTSGEEWARIPHTGTVTAVSFSPGENILATASSRFVQLWDTSKFTPITKDELVEEACSRMIENLDQALWSALFGGKEYRLLCPDL